MAFDRTDPADLAALNSEVFTDPLGQGYDPDSTESVTSIINDVAQNNTNPSTVERSLDDVTVPEVSAVINEVEYAALDEYDKKWTDALIVQPGDDSGTGSATTLRPYKGKFLEVFPNGTVTNNNARDLLIVEGSRAESLFGAGTVITRDDWVAARDI